jgi:hypothetical protein
MIPQLFAFVGGWPDVARGASRGIMMIAAQGLSIGQQNE